MPELTEQIGRVFGDGPTWLTVLRGRYYELYRQMPIETSELYIRHYETPEIDDERLIEMVQPSDVDEFPEDFRHLKEDREHAVVVFIGNMLKHLYIPENMAAKGLELSPFSEALRKHEGFIHTVLENLMNSRYLDKYTCLTHALLNAGVYINIPSNTEVSKPIRLVYVSESSGKALFTKTLLNVGERSKVSIVEEFHGIHNPKGSVVGHHVEIFAADSSVVRHGVLQNLSHDQPYVSNRVIRAGRNSDVTVVGAVIGGGTSKIRVDNVLEGDGSTLKDLEIVFGDGDQKIDLTANLHHIGFGTQGKMLAKGVVKDRSRSIFKGVITIERQAKATNSYLAEHAMIMSPDSRAYAIPSLEIMTDEVKATHSASVSQIDPEQVYYLMARGIPYEEARKLLALGFFEPVVSQIDLDEVRWGLRSLLESKWGGRVTELFEEPEVTVTSLFGTHYKYRYAR